MSMPTGAGSLRHSRRETTNSNRSDIWRAGVMLSASCFPLSMTHRTRYTAAPAAMELCESRRKALLSPEGAAGSGPSKP
jgi:hypothetical protein